jgi:predicted DNA-binding transcriptional regulator AlpA
MEHAIRLIRDTETAAILGCSRATVWALVKAGKIPAPIKIGAMARWRIADIHAAIDKAASAPGAKEERKPRVRNRSRLGIAA